MSANAIQKISDNLFAVPVDTYERLFAQGARAFRFTDDGKFALVQANPKKPLTENEICQINLRCDQVEGTKNREIKSIILSAIRARFNQSAGFQLIEFGAGLHPLTAIREGKDDYHAIEIDRDIITKLQDRGYSASTIDTIEEGTLTTDKTRIAAGVYTLHFWDPQKAPDDIKTVISHDGFFVANYMNSKRNLDPQHAENLIKSFRENGLSVSIVKQGVQKTANDNRSGAALAHSLGNEFWVVSYPPERNGMKAESTRLAENLGIQLSQSRPGDMWMKQRTYDAV